MAVNITTDTNTVKVTSTSTNNVKIVDNGNNTSVSVSQPTTRVIKVATVGPQGPAGVIANTGSFATTGSNTFKGKQILSASQSNLSALDIHAVDHALWAFRVYNDLYSSTQPGLGSWIDNTGEANIGTEVNKPLYIYTNANYGNPTLIISSSGVTVTNNLTVTGNQVITGSLTVSGSSTFTNIGPAVFSGSVGSTQGFTGSLQGTASIALTASFAQGYVLNSNTSSFVVNSQTGSFLTNLSTASLATSASYALTASYALNGGGTTVNTGSFATTGSNTFVGNQIISGAVNTTGTLTVQNAITTPSGQYFVVSSDTSTEMSWSVPFAPSIAVSSGIGTGPSGTSIANMSTDSNGDALPIKYWNFNMDGTTTVPGNLTGAANLATTGSVTFTGQQIVTGSTRGNVTALSITSNTASINLSTGNFFTLQLVSGSNTFINPSNILPGQTSILTLSTTGSATVSWPSFVRQPSGSAYVPTTTTGIDIITLASVNTSSLYVVGIKNMI
jgi:hypothetical protein